MLNAAHKYVYLIAIFLQSHVHRQAIDALQATHAAALEQLRAGAMKQVESAMSLTEQTRSCQLFT